MWGIDEQRNIGQYDRTGKFLPKYHYDTVFGPRSGNRDIYESVAQPLIMPALEVRWPREPNSRDLNTSLVHSL